MTSVYPKEQRSNDPPTYEQATYPQAPPIPSFLGIHSTSRTILEPQVPPPGMYLTSAVDPSATVKHPVLNMNLPPQGPPVATQMLVTTQSLIYGDMPIQCICPHCHQAIVTRVEKKTGLVSWLVCGGIVLVGGWLGCCLIPFCVDSLKDTDHYCPSCAVLLGTRRRM